MADSSVANHLAQLKHDGWSTVPSDPLTRSPELDDRIARLQARGRGSASAASKPSSKPPSRRKPPMPPGPAALHLPTVDENDENGSTATVTFLTPLSEEPQADEHATEVLSLEPVERSNGWLPGVATSMAMWRPGWSVSRSVATGASAVSFAAMVVAMGPLFEAAGESETTTGGEPAVGDPAAAGEQPAPSPSVGIVTAPVDPATAALLPSTEGVPVADTLADADPNNPAVDPASTGATAPAEAAPAATAPPATAAPAPAGGGGGTPAPQPTAAPQPADPAPTAAPTTAAPATQAPATAAPTTAAPTTAAPTTPAPTQPPTTPAPTTPPPSSGGSG